MPRHRNIQGRCMVLVRVQSARTKAWEKENEPKPRPHHWALGTKRTKVGKWKKQI